MGICSSLKSHHRSGGYQKVQPGSSANTKNIKTPPRPDIPTRISDKTTLDDISKYYNISNKFLGRGASGFVREATDNISGQRYAIKTIWKGDLKKKASLNWEIEISLDVQHKNIIKCHKVYEDSSSLNFVLEILEGGDLFDYIVQSPNGKLEEFEAMDLMYQILDSLAYLHHTLKVVHRDIKPENFLMYNDNGKHVIKLIDFGFAKRVKENELMDDKVGTTEYAAPELLNDEYYTEKADIWSCGIVFYNMISGAMPFNKNTHIPVQEQVISSPIDFSVFTNPKLRRFCKNLLTRKSEERYTAIQALNDLKMLMRPDASQMTIPHRFQPDIKKIVYLIGNDDDPTLVNELRNIYLSHLDIDTIVQLKTDLKISRDVASSVNNENKFLAVDKLIKSTVQKKPEIIDSLKSEIEELIQKYGEIKMEKQMINTDAFLTNIIVMKKFLQKEEILKLFKKFDQDSVGYLSSHQLNQIFSDPEKKRSVSINEKETVYFDKFYLMWVAYEGIAAEF